MRKLATSRPAVIALLCGVSVLFAGIASSLHMQWCDNHATFERLHVDKAALTDADVCCEHMQRRDDCGHCHPCERVPVTTVLLVPVAPENDTGFCNAATVARDIWISVLTAIGAIVIDMAIAEPTGQGTPASATNQHTAQQIEVVFVVARGKSLVHF